MKKIILFMNLFIISTISIHSSIDTYTNTKKSVTFDEFKNQTYDCTYESTYIQECLCYTALIKENIRSNLCENMREKEGRILTRKEVRSIKASRKTKRQEQISKYNECINQDRVLTLTSDERIKIEIKIIEEIMMKLKMKDNI